jgi:hypothetical protein
MTSGFPAGGTEERRYLTHLLLQLIAHEQHRDADYVMAILQTDAAEADQVPPGRDWLAPGQTPLGRSPVYEAALRWCRGGFRQP